jgi:hypothetical protein
MPLIEVDEAAYKRAEQNQALIAKIMANPEERRKFMATVKAVEPERSVPEIDAVAPVNAAIEALTKKVDDGLKAITDAADKRAADDRKAKLERDWEDGRAKLRSMKYTEEGIKKIEDMMQSKGILDHTDAAIIFDKHNPPATPASPVRHSPAFNFYDLPTTGAEDTKKLLESKGEDSGALSNLINSALAEVRAAR